MLTKVTLKGNRDSGSGALIRMPRSRLEAASTHLSCSGLDSIGSAFWSVVTMALSRLKQERNPKGGSDMIKGHIFMACSYVLGQKSKLQIAIPC